MGQNPQHGETEPAFPVPEVITDHGDQVKVEFHGVTIRQYAAIHIHAALAGTNYGMGNYYRHPDDLVIETMAHVDALMKEIAE